MNGFWHRCLHAAVVCIGVITAGCALEGHPGPTRDRLPAGSTQPGIAPPQAAVGLAARYEGTVINDLLPGTVGRITLTFSSTSPGRVEGYLRVRVLGGSGNVTGTLTGSQLTLRVVMDNPYPDVDTFTMNGVLADDRSLSGTFMVPLSIATGTVEWGTWQARPA